MATAGAPGSEPSEAEEAVAGRRRSRRPYFLPGLAAFIVLLGIGLGFGAGDLDHRSPSSLNGPDTARDISFGIQAERGSTSPPAVTCPAAEPVRTGWQFTCYLGPPRAGTPIRVTESDGHGHLSWVVGPPGG